MGGDPEVSDGARHPGSGRSHPRFCVLVTTYANPEGLQRLLEDLERERLPGMDVRVYDDGTAAQDDAVIRRIVDHGWTYRRADVNHGKENWWRWWNTILADLRAQPAEFFVGLQDDVRLCTGFFERAWDLWTSIDDQRKASLYLHVTPERGRAGSTCWTRVRAQQAGRVIHSGWMDLAAFLCSRRMFERLGWELQPVPANRWQGHPERSSGVGQQISLRADALGLRMYRTEMSLVLHGTRPSLMNPAARERWEMTTVGFADGDAAAARLLPRRPPALATLASIPSRVASLETVVSTLRPQVDRLGVYLNGFGGVPGFLRDADAEVVRSQDHGDRGDAGKFYWAGRHRGFHLICDDDLNYPGDYADVLIRGLERLGRRAVAGFHGSLLMPPVRDYHRSRTLFHMSIEALADRPVHVLGTGVMGYHSSTIRVRPDDFARPNMADIWMALLGQRQRVPFILLRHHGRWVYELPGTSRDSLYAQARARAGAPGPSHETREVLAHRDWVLSPWPSPDGVRSGPALVSRSRRR